MKLFAFFLSNLKIHFKKLSKYWFWSCFREHRLTVVVSAALVIYSGSFGRCCVKYLWP